MSDIVVGGLCAFCFAVGWLLCYARFLIRAGYVKPLGLQTCWYKALKYREMIESCQRVAAAERRYYGGRLIDSLHRRRLFIKFPVETVYESVLTDAETLYRDAENNEFKTKEHDYVPPPPLSGTN